MDDNIKHFPSYQLDQELLDARGINMTVAEVAGLPTVKYNEKVLNLQLNKDDLAFLKGLRRRIKNRLASQNGRRRNMERLRRLTKELRAVRACRHDALAERRVLLQQRDAVRKRCQQLRNHVSKILKDRSDRTEVPEIDVDRIIIPLESQMNPSKDIPVKKVTVSDTKIPLLAECFRDQNGEKEKTVFECRIDKLVQQSVNHIYKTDKNNKVYAKTVFISNEKSCITHTSNVRSVVITHTDMNDDLKDIFNEECPGVLNLSVKEEKTRSRGRKQSAPRRIAYAFTDNDDGVLDLKIKKEAP